MRNPFSQLWVELGIRPRASWLVHCELSLNSHSHTPKKSVKSRPFQAGLLCLALALSWCGTSQSHKLWGSWSNLEKWWKYFWWPREMDIVGSSDQGKRDCTLQWTYSCNIRSSIFSLSQIFLNLTWNVPAAWSSLCCGWWILLKQVCGVFMWCWGAAARMSSVWFVLPLSLAGHLLEPCSS